VIFSFPTKVGSVASKCCKPGRLVSIKGAKNALTYIAVVLSVENSVDEQRPNYDPFVVKITVLINGVGVEEYRFGGVSPIDEKSENQPSSVVH
jgi:hypothetical protein